MRPTAAAAAFLALSAVPAAAQDLYGVNADGDLVRIDPSNPASVTVVGPLGLPAGRFAGSLTYDPTSDRFFSIALEGPSPNDRDFFLVAIDPATGAATTVGLVMESTVTGQVESIDYVHALDAIVISHSDGGANDFLSNQHAIVDRTTAALTPLATTNRDADASCYDPFTDTYYVLDPNGTDWSRVDLGTGNSANAGAALDTIGDLSLLPRSGSIYGLDFNSNELYRFDLQSFGLSVGPATSLGVMGTTQMNGLAFKTESIVGTPYCPAVPNSTGVPSQLLAFGSDLLSDNSVTLTAASLPVNAFGFFLASRTTGFAANPGGSQGNICLGGAIGRYVGPGEVQTSQQLGAFSLDIDLTAVPQPTGFVSAAVGETWNFQAWHRDIVAGQSTSNFTQGLAITLR